MSTTNILDLNNRIDELADSYPASKVMMSDGVTSVEDALDGLTANTSGTAINITAYNSSDNQYTFPSDGYVELRASTSPSTRITFLFNGIVASANYSGADTYNAFFVRKGMKGYVYANYNSGLARFIPFT